MERRNLLLCLALVLLYSAPLQSGQPKFDTVLYGASYYHEYMPYDRLEQDVELMQKAGLTVVRVGESTWSSWEPREGEFQFAWMERILDRMHKATPTKGKTRAPRRKGADNKKETNR